MYSLISENYSTKFPIEKKTRKDNNEFLQYYDIRKKKYCITTGLFKKFCL